MAASRAGRSWRTGLAGAVAVHAILVVAVALSVKIASPPKEAPSFEITLVQPWRPPPEHERRPPPKTTASPAPPAPVLAPHIAPIPTPKVRVILQPPC